MKITGPHDDTTWRTPTALDHICTTPALDHLSSPAAGGSSEGSQPRLAEIAAQAVRNRVSADRGTRSATAVLCALPEPTRHAMTRRHVPCFGAPPPRGAHSGAGPVHQQQWDPNSRHLGDDQTLRTFVSRVHLSPQQELFLGPKHYLLLSIVF